jgi:hypothetical protein
MEWPMGIELYSHTLSLNNARRCRKSSRQEAPGTTSKMGIDLRHPSALEDEMGSQLRSSCQSSLEMSPSAGLSP